MRAALVIAIAACSAPAPREPLSSKVTPSKTRSCALRSPMRTPTPKLALRKWLGRIGPRSWVIVERDRRLALAALGTDGALQIVDLPASVEDHIIETAIENARLWLVVGEPGLGVGEEIVYAIDLDGPTPKIERVEALAAKTIAGASSFAIGSTRALFFTFAAQAGFQLWDRTRHAPLVTVKHGAPGLDPPPVRCVRSNCFAVAVTDDGPTRRLTAFRFTDTRADREELATDHLGSVLLAPTGDRSVVLWNSYSRRGLFARTLDAEGKPIDREVALASGRASDPQWVPPGPHVAYRDDDWMLATMSADYRRRERVVALGLRDAFFLTTAKTLDGTVAIGFSTSNSYHGERVPPTKAHAVFVPDGSDPAAPIDLLGGAERFNYTAFPLVAPGQAAALVLAQGHEPSDGELVVLREPCTQ